MQEPGREEGAAKESELCSVRDKEKLSSNQGRTDRAMEEEDAAALPWVVSVVLYSMYARVGL